MPRRPMDTGPAEQIAIRLPARLLSRLDTYAAALGVHPPAGTTRVTRALALRLALERGLDAIEAEAATRGDSTTGT